MSPLAGRAEPADWSSLTDIRGERHGPIQIPWLWILLALALAAAAFAYYRRAVRRRPPAPPRPAHVTAEIELDRLLRERLLDRGEIERFVTRLSEILRRYIEARFQLRAPTRSTEEFYEDLKSSAVLSVSEQQTVIEFLRRSDLVKFAADRMDSANAMLLLDTVRLFVRQTRDDPERQAEIRRESARAA